MYFVSLVWKYHSCSTHRFATKFELAEPAREQDLLLELELVVELGELEVDADVDRQLVGLGEPVAQALLDAIELEERRLADAAWRNWKYQPNSRRSVRPYSSSVVRIDRML